MPDYKKYYHIYTDGSKQNDKTGFGFYSEDISASEKIENDASIFTAEVEAIREAIHCINTNPKLKNRNNFVIFSDSKSALDSIENQSSRNPLMIDLLDSLQKLRKRNINIEFCWVPSHVGIQGNHKADDKAKDGLDKSQTDYFKFPYTDYIPKVKTFICEKWQQRWDYKHLNDRPIKLHDILPVLGPFYMNGLSRKDEVIIHRIRIGHTRLTHKYLMEGRPEPVCPHCGALLTVLHFMVECQHFAAIRRDIYQASVNDMRDLFQKVPLTRIIRFLRATNLYKEI